MGGGGVSLETSRVHSQARRGGRWRLAGSHCR